MVKEIGAYRKLLNILLYLIGIFVISIGVVTAYQVSISPGLILIVAGVLLVPFTWDKIGRFFSILHLYKFRFPVALVLVAGYFVLVGNQLDQEKEYSNYIAELDQQLNTNVPGTRGVMTIDDLPDPNEMEVGKFYALVIGINNYTGDWPALDNAVNDAKAVEKVLRNKYTFDEIFTLYNENATRDDIIEAFEKLIDQVNENDNVLIYYSGHGEFRSKMNKGYWVPVDAKTKSTKRYINNLDVRSYIEGIKSKHTLLIADACFSGDIFRGVGDSRIQFDNSEKYYKTVYNKPSRQAISSGGIEPVMDGGSDGHSIFTYHLLKALNGNDKKFMDAGELYNQIRIPIVNNSEQTPIFAPIKNAGDEGGQFIFINKSEDSPS